MQGLEVEGNFTGLVSSSKLGSTTSSYKSSQAASTTTLIIKMRKYKMPPHSLAAY
jgi:hypothetical protein